MRDDRGYVRRAAMSERLPEVFVCLLVQSLGDHDGLVDIV